MPETRRRSRRSARAARRFSAILDLDRRSSERDDLVRESYFESFFAVTGVHFPTSARAGTRATGIDRAHPPVGGRKHGGDDAFAASRSPLDLARAPNCARSRRASRQRRKRSGRRRRRAAQRCSISDRAPWRASRRWLESIRRASRTSARDLRSASARSAIATAAPELIGRVARSGDRRRGLACQALARSTTRAHCPPCSAITTLAVVAATNRIPPESGTRDGLLALAAATCSKLGDTRLDGELIVLAQATTRPRATRPTGRCASASARSSTTILMSIDDGAQRVARFQTISSLIVVQSLCSGATSSAKCAA